ncbi:MAG: hypothetical protein J07HQW2_00928 [Haloquadratum walsbyi J07HQW2]|uniref:Uncharacterized protein n=1 Tax=Haloquadratum walsbyi J07HQW2 TaxID=1238425 RepID=U1MVR5_9EURY|nr:MAG: hypothetical protein J07HQW2_00928 [Haloquadratum walsbyi J07HQW2]
MAVSRPKPSNQAVIEPTLVTGRVGVGSETDPMQCSALPCPARLLASTSKSVEVCWSSRGKPNPPLEAHIRPKIREESSPGGRGFGLALPAPAVQSCPTTLHSPRHSPRTLHRFSPCQGSVGWGGMGLNCNPAISSPLLLLTLRIPPSSRRGGCQSNYWY